MPPKKKKGKGSKLARMSEEERLRYLQHRAELELEAKKRKQELITVFTKNKLKREEAFARINNAKLSEQWRFVLRQIKCKELHEEVDYLRKNYERTLEAKDNIISTLYEKLKLAELENSRLQESHFQMIENLLGKHRKRLEEMHQDYRMAIEEKNESEIEEINVLRKEAIEEHNYLETVIFVESKFEKSRLTQVRTRNATNIRGMEYSTEDEIGLLKKNVGGKIEDLWKELDSVIRDYESLSLNKRKHYEYLKEQDDSVRNNSGQFFKTQLNLQNQIEHLKECNEKRKTEAREMIKELKIQGERLNDEISKLRQETRINQMTDAVRLKSTNVASSSIIKKLKTIEEKSLALLTIAKMCSRLEPNSSIVKNYAMNCEQVSNETKEICVTNPYDRLTKFWEVYNYAKAETIYKKCERSELMLENKRLRQALRNYLLTLSRKTPGNSKN